VLAVITFPACSSSAVQQLSLGVRVQDEQTDCPGDGAHHSQRAKAGQIGLRYV
jgi:hypothetical protein